jgi:hypothetical protein
VDAFSGQSEKVWFPLNSIFSRCGDPPYILCFGGSECKQLFLLCLTKKRKVEDEKLAITNLL